MLTVAISSRALFDFSEANAIYENEGLSAYKAYQIKNESKPLNKGVCFPLVRKLLALNEHAEQPLIDVVLCTRNSADSGLRVFNSITHYALPITRGIFSDGRPVHDYLKAYGVQLFLSANAADVSQSIAVGVAAATILPQDNHQETRPLPDQLRIAFDADCVLFSDDIEKIHLQYGLDAFAENEKKHAKEMLPQGPFSAFAKAFSTVQKALPTDCQLIRTALVTARSAPAHERVILTLRAWGVSIDESFFLGGHDKSRILSVYQPDIFFDDRISNCVKSAQAVPTGHVPFGITNA